MLFPFEVGVRPEMLPHGGVQPFVVVEGFVESECRHGVDVLVRTLLASLQAGDEANWPVFEVHARMMSNVKYAHGVPFTFFVEC